jgi:hypothetical protein
MVLALSIILYAIVGTAIGRILFVKRMRDQARFQVIRGDSYAYTKDLVDSAALKSAQTYGLWSPFIWPFTLMFFLIQAPTPTENRISKEKELKEIQEKFTNLAKELELDYK